MADTRTLRDFTSQQYERAIFDSLKDGGPTESLLHAYAVVHPRECESFVATARLAIALSKGG